AEDAAPHQRADHRQAGDPDRREPPVPEQSNGTDEPQTDKQNRSERWTPVFFVRIGTEKDEAMLLGDETPAGAVRRAAGLGVGLPDRVEESPVDERRNELDQQNKDHERHERARPRGEEVLPKPLHLRRALYQF